MGIQILLSGTEQKEIKKGLNMTTSKTKRVLSRQELDMNKWWTSLTITNKENLSGQPYPVCTSWWNHITLAERVKIHNESGISRSPRNYCQGFT